jgi:hypothetical protein
MFYLGVKCTVTVIAIARHMMIEVSPGANPKVVELETV